MWREKRIVHLQRGWMLRKARTQAVKWTTEGTRNEAYGF